MFAGAVPVAMDFEETSHERAENFSAMPRVVIVGGGFGGLSVAKGLAGQPFDITLIDRNNHHLFQPLLYQVATAGLSPADIASPIRNILSGQRNAKVMLAEVTGVDLETREVITDSRRVPYDYSGARDRRAPRLFRPRRLGVLCAGPEIDRRRHLSAPPHPDGLRARRERERSGRAPPADDLRGDRRRPDRCRDGRRDRRACEARACRRLPFDRFALRAHHPGRGGAARADALHRGIVGEGAPLARTARRRGAARTGGDRLQLRRHPRSAATIFRRAPSSGPPA